MAVRITRAGVALTVGIILAAVLVIAGLLWVKNAGEQARREEAVKIAEQNLRDQANTETALNDESTNEQENSSQNQSEATPNDTTENSGSVATNPQSADSTAELPQTGPSGIAAIFGTGLLTFFGVAYYRSRRSLLK
ncbi:MAG: LPXTG cell wall anchor domain-containing protein [Candidatus Microsaccharimonas sp.]